MGEGYVQVTLGDVVLLRRDGRELARGVVAQRDKQRAVILYCAVAREGNPRPLPSQWATSDRVSPMIRKANERNQREILRQREIGTKPKKTARDVNLDYDLGSQ